MINHLRSRATWRSISQKCALRQTGTSTALRGEAQGDFCSMARGFRRCSTATQQWPLLKKKSVGNREIHGVFFWVHLKASLKIEVYYSISRHKRNIIQFGNSMKFDPHEKKHPAIDNTVVHCNCFQCVSSGFIREVLPGSNTYMLYIKLSIPCLKCTKQTPQTYRYLLYGVGDADVYPLQKWVESGNRLHLLFEKITSFPIRSFSPSLLSLQDQKNIQ